MPGNTANKTFSVKNGLDVANTVVLDSSRNLSNIVAINATSTINSTNEIAGSTLRSTQSADEEGGQIDLAKPASNTSISGNIAIDIYQNKIRFFETGGTNRGAYIDFTAANTGVGSNLLAGGGGGGAAGPQGPQGPQGPAGSPATMAFSFMSKTFDYTITAGDATNNLIVKNSSNSVVTFTLPSASSVGIGKMIYITSTSTSTPQSINVLTDGSDLFFGFYTTPSGTTDISATTLSNISWVQLISDGTSWNILGMYW